MDDFNRFILSFAGFQELSPKIYQEIQLKLQKNYSPFK